MSKNIIKMIHENLEKKSTRVIKLNELNRQVRRLSIKLKEKILLMCDSEGKIYWVHLG